MSFETHFWFTFAVTPTLLPEHRAILLAFADGDRKRVDDPTVSPSQPDGACHWEPTPDGKEIRWSEHTKFYDYDVWLRYLIAHFLAPWGTSSTARSATRARATATKASLPSHGMSLPCATP